jgi:hypothetical protein
MRVSNKIQNSAVRICRHIRHQCVPNCDVVSRDGDMKWSLGIQHLHSLGAFAKLLKAIIRHVMFVFIPVRPHATTRFPLNEFLWIFCIVVPCILITSRFFSPTNVPFYWTHKMLKRTVKISLCLLLHAVAHYTARSTQPEILVATTPHII